MKTIVTATALALCVTACSSLDYEPASGRSFAEVANGNCEEGERAIVTGQVSDAYQNTLVLRSSGDSRETLPVTLGGRGWWSRVKGWFGTNRYELTAQQLQDLAARNTPVNVTLECRGDGLSPVAERLTYVNPEGMRVAFDY